MIGPVTAKHFSGIQTRKVYMDEKPLLVEEKITNTLERIPGSSFTILDFVQVFKKLHPEDWQRLV